MLANWLNDLGACSSAIDWIDHEGFETLQDAWDACDHRADWMMWWLNFCNQPCLNIHLEMWKTCYSGYDNFLVTAHRILSEEDFHDMGSMTELLQAYRSMLSYGHETKKSCVCLEQICLDRDLLIYYESKQHDHKELCNMIRRYYPEVPDHRG
jgi:hypothetical protein